MGPGFASVIVNGVDAATGQYLLPPMTTRDVAELAMGTVPAAREVAELRARRHRDTERFLGVREGVEPTDLAEAGWGVIFPTDGDPSIREALAPLLVHRRNQASALDERRYREFANENGVRPDESKGAFLARHGVGPGPSDPDRMPYYLMLVCGPDAVSFPVQYQLDVQYAAGRLHFDDVESYARYAEAVIASERATTEARDSVVLFAPRHPDDAATALSSDELVGPLAARLSADLRGWNVATVLADDATATALQDLFSDWQVPGLLFTATHGVGFRAADPRQRSEQGALLCQGWPGPRAGRPVAREEYFAAADLTSAANLSGLISFHVACFGAGTPQTDGFARRSAPGFLAPESFVAALPQRMLSSPGGPALAVVGHIDRAWGFSFSWPGAGEQSEAVRSCLRRICMGQPVGYAMEYLNQRYAELASDVATLLEEAREGRRVDEALLTGMWTASNDARGYALLGDPAVRLPVPSASSNRAVSAGNFPAPSNQETAGSEEGRHDVA
jgi:hypothetical protein